MIAVIGGVLAESAAAAIPAGDWEPGRYQRMATTLEAAC
jgi:hypothetical protein